MAMFNSYVCLPKGKLTIQVFNQPSWHLGVVSEKGVLYWIDANNSHAILISPWFYTRG